MIVVGSSLVVNPAARLPAIARERGAKLVIINPSTTPLDDLADVRIYGAAGEALQGIVERLGDDAGREAHHGR
jgi:NAD-dependent deacetylase